MAKPDLRDPQNCLCFNLRKAARAVSRSYDAALAPAGITTAQFSTLATLAGTGPVAMTALARLMETERTTLTRNLNLLEREALVSRQAGDDLRERRIALTAKGRRTLAAATPLWREAQAALIERLGRQPALAVLHTTDAIEQALSEPG